MSRKRVWWFRGLALGGMIAVAGVAWYIWNPDPEPDPEYRPAPDPRLTVESPFENVRPDVGYVGSAACAECHSNISDTFAQHPMGRSALPADELARLADLSEGTHTSFEAKHGRQFRVERRDGRLFHIDGELAEPIDYAIGSGTHGISYLIEREGGFLFQSPISWFSAAERWDLSPGFTRERHFTRPIPSECVACHTGRPLGVPSTISRYQPPIFTEMAIGCERCHGPGETHVQKHRGRDLEPVGFDPTIVNPVHLDRHLRESVCQQCHLQGAQTVLRRDRSVMDFRPGLPVELFFSVYVRPERFADNNRAVTQVQQMHGSACYQGSPEMDCTSCHDPHRKPVPEETVTHYRSRCLLCHEETSCGLDVAERRAEHADDNCVACHMPKADTSNIAHTALTDHRILKNPTAESSGRPVPLRPGELPLLRFHADGPALDEAELDRDLGIALVRAGMSQGPAGAPAVRRGLRMLKEATVAFPGDVPAWVALGQAENLGRNHDRALTAMRQALRFSPEDEGALAEGALAALHAKDDADLELARKAVAVNPWAPDYHGLVAEALARRSRWSESADACRECLRLNPTDRGIRMRLIVCLLREGETDLAAAEFAKLLDDEPGDTAQLRRWYRSQGGR